MEAALMVQEELRDKLYKYVDPCKAVETLIKGINPVIERTDVKTAAWRIVAEDLYSPVNRPPFNIAHVDGYALMSSDTIGASSKKPAVLRVVEGVNPREAHKYFIKHGEAVLVETGYPIPVNADAVVRVESVRKINDTIFIYKELRTGEEVFKAGSDYKAGDLVVSKGTLITPAVQKTLIDLGISSVNVYKLPKVALITVGSEVVNEVTTDYPNKLSNSSMYLIKGILEAQGYRVLLESIILDEPSEIASAISKALREAEVVITIGGLSMGPRDYTWTSVVRAFKPKKFFRGVKIHPGRTTSGFSYGGRAVINLPGLPQSTLAGLLTVALPTLRYLRGLEPQVKLPYFVVKLSRDEEFREYIGFYRLRFIEVDEAQGTAKVIRGYGTYHLAPIVKSSGLIVVNPGVTLLNANTYVKAFIVPGVHKYLEENLIKY
ncbi:MAG: molybdopterin molybdotransferase MoeA [Desulfurococcaceae archaeon]